MTFKKTAFPVNRICFVGVLILFLILESLEIFLPTWNIPITIIKGLTSIIPVALALYATIKLPDFFNIAFTIVLFAYFIGDILIRINFVAGVVAFFIANLLMSLIFVKSRGFSKSQLLLYLFSLVIALVIFIIFKETLGIFFYPVLVYAFVLIFMLISSISMPHLIRIGAIVFFISDLLLGVGLAGFGNTVVSFISLGLYYIAICILANAAYKRTFE